VALAHISLRLAWQAWHLAIHLHFVWQAWHLATSTFVSRGRRGTCAHQPSFGVAGVALGDINLLKAGVALGHIHK